MEKAFLWVNKRHTGGKKTNTCHKYNTVLLLLLSHFSRVRLCATPQTVAHQALPSLGFSRQEHWSGLPFPSPIMKGKSESKVAQSCLTLCDPMDCSPPGSSVHGIFQARVLEWVAIAFSNTVLITYKIPLKLNKNDKVIIFFHSKKIWTGKLWFKKKRPKYSNSLVKKKNMIKIMIPPLATGKKKILDR